MAKFTGADQADIDSELEEAFSGAIGATDYQRLLDEKWLPFQGTAHLNMTFPDALGKEVAAAREFLGSL
jgi:hypothetical protein